MISHLYDLGPNNEENQVYVCSSWSQKAQMHTDFNQINAPCTHYNSTGRELFLGAKSKTS